LFFLVWYNENGYEILEWHFFQPMVVCQQQVLYYQNIFRSHVCVYIYACMHLQYTYRHTHAHSHLPMPTRMHVHTQTHTLSHFSLPTSWFHFYHNTHREHPKVLWNLLHLQKSWRHCSCNVVHVAMKFLLPEYILLID
jgi:hypothetical protein